MQDVQQEFLNRWDLTLLSLVADTGAARVWTVRRRDGSTAALKLYRRADRGNEAPGSALLARWQDRGAVTVLEEADNAILMEWLDGPSLGDIAREGRPEFALRTLAQTAKRLHNDRIADMRGLKPLADVFAPLFELRFEATCAKPLRRDMARATDIARKLLETQETVVPLHGDLHPDNVILTEAGPRVIDAKGYIGDPAFELANALRHPKGMPDLVRQTSQIDTCLTLYANALEVSRARLAKWAAAKCALSIFWRSNGRITQDKEADLLTLFLQAGDQ